jgi:hypothetical protein
MQLLYHNELKAGDTVSIYTDYQQESPKTYEGEAILVEKHSDMHSFTLYNEKLLTREEDKVIDPKTGKHAPLTREQLSNNKKWERMCTFFENEPTKEIKLIRDSLKRKLSRNDKSLIEFFRALRRIRFRYTSDISKVGFFFEMYDNQTLLRFFQQRYMRSWSPTLYREERWLVEFIPNQYSVDTQMCLYGSPFRTYRKLRTIACVCPSEDIQYCEIHKHYTDSDGISNNDRRLRRLKVKELALNPEEDDDSDDDLLDDLDDNYYADNTDNDADNDDNDDNDDIDISDESMITETVERYAQVPFEDTHLSDYDRTLESGDDDYY